MFSRLKLFRLLPAFLVACLLNLTVSGFSFGEGPMLGVANLEINLTRRASQQDIVAAPPQMEAIRAKIKKQVESGEIPSFAIAVSRGGKIIWMEAFGWANRDSKTEATLDTIYPLASVSKSITATALMTLAEKEKVNLFDPAEKYLGAAKLTSYRGKSSDLRVIDLINMTGGIPHYWQFYYPEDKQISLVERINRYGIVVFPPGKVYSYSNFSFAVAEQVVTQTAGQNLDDYLRSQVFAPLGMTNTFLGFQPAVKKQIAAGYDFQNKPVTHSDFEPKGGAGFFSSAADLIRYGMFHLKNKTGGRKKVLSDEFIDGLHYNPAPNSPNKGYTGGWANIDLGGYNLLLSNGSVMGSQSTLLLLPSEDAAIVCLTNTSKGEGLTDQTAFEIANVLKPDFNEKFSKIVAEAEAREAGKDYKPAPQFVGVWSGKIKTYSGEVPLTVNFDANGKVYVQIKGQMEALLNRVRIENGMLKGRFAGSIPTDDAARRCHRIELEMFIDNDEMYGIAKAQSTDPQPGFGLPSYIELRKNKTQ
jgi:CubicO group peptidase (beta-lactamase class C family)